MAAVVNRYPGCLICIHPGTRASQRLERYSKGGRFPCSPRVSPRVFVCNSSRFLLFVLSLPPSLSLYYSTIRASRFPYLPRSILPSTRFHRGFRVAATIRGAARIPRRREAIVSNRAKPGNTFGIGAVVVGGGCFCPLLFARRNGTFGGKRRQREREREVSSGFVVSSYTSYSRTVTHDADSGTVREFLSRHLSRFYIYTYINSFFSRGVRYDDSTCWSESVRSSFDIRDRGWNVLGWVEKIGGKKRIEAYGDGRSFDGR